MDEAKAVINIKEGVIELQGPVDFVRHYLDRYQFAIKELQGLPKSVAVRPEKAEALPRKEKKAPRRKARRIARGSCTGAIRSCLDQGFFAEPRSIGEVKQKLSETGLTYADGAVRAGLKRLVQSGSLGTTGKRTSLRYHKP